MKIGVDLISGESPIEELVQGCIDAVEADPDIHVVMIGKGDVYQPLLQDKKIVGQTSEWDRISILEASEVITMHDDPLKVMKKKRLEYYQRPSCP